MNRTLLSLVLAAGLFVAWAGVARASVLDADQMKAALHTATPQESGFIDTVVARVDKGTLPLDLVQSTFLWAKKKPSRKFFYFRQALISRAADRGINL